jgi:hypothetical protein
LLVHVGSLETEQPRRIVGEDALSHPVIGRPFTQHIIEGWMVPTQSWNDRCGKSLPQISWSGTLSISVCAIGFTSAKFGAVEKR